MNKNRQDDQTRSRDSKGDQDIARQWIDYLKRRNTTLNILVMTFLVAALLLGASSTLLYLNVLEVEKATILARSNADQLSQKLNTLSSRYESLQETTRQLEQDLKDKNARLNELQSFKGETDSQLNLTARLVDALKQKVASLEKENSLLEEALIESETKLKGTLAESQGNRQMLQEQKNMLTSRKSAYDALVKRHRETEEEMRRLADELLKAGEREQDLDRRNEYLVKELQAEQRALKEAQEQNIILSDRLRALTSPIIPKSNPAPVAPVQSAPSLMVSPNLVAPEAPSEASETGQSGAEVKPKVPLTGSSPLDFDSIVIE
ncbi:MAG: hypothetical protein C9356_15960 [Oleiphilus sp.]|nr:MAG: hypothetical protein C9356_15960 [Oleiphilus sp.]